MTNQRHDHVTSTRTDSVSLLLINSNRVLSKALKGRFAYLRRNIVVTTRPFAIILVALESPYKVLEHNVSRLFIKALVRC